MTHLMIEIVGVWFVAILLGLPLFASMGLAAFAFVLLGGLSGSIVHAIPRASSLYVCRISRRSKPSRSWTSRRFGP